MTCSFACKDLGMDCAFVAKGKDMNELMTKAVKHGKEVHGYTDAQLKDPEMIKKVKEKVKC